MTALVGLYGGTFNPIHLGHLRAAEEVVERLDLERMIFVPCARPPHKEHQPRGEQPARDADNIAPAKDRLEWTRLAVMENSRFEVDPIEVERSGPSYLIDTLREFGKRLAPALPVFTLGHDAFAEIGSWREPATLLSLAHFAVVVRPPMRGGRLCHWLPDALRDEVELAPDGRSGRHRKADSWIRLVEISGLDLSASQIREMLRQGRSTRYLLPERARQAIEKSGHYAAGKAGEGRGS